MNRFNSINRKLNQWFDDLDQTTRLLLFMLMMGSILIIPLMGVLVFDASTDTFFFLQMLSYSLLGMVGFLRLLDRRLVRGKL